MPSIPALLLSRKQIAPVFVALLAFSLLVPSLASAQRRPIIVQTNAAGDNVHLNRPGHEHDRGGDYRRGSDPRCCLGSGWEQAVFDE